MATRHWGPVKTKSNEGRCLGRRHCSHTSHSIHCNLITPQEGMKEESKKEKKKKVGGPALGPGPGPRGSLIRPFL